MTSFVHLDYPKSHPGVERFETAVTVAGRLGKSFENGKGLAGVLLAAMMAALLVVADQLIETWADGHLLAAWVMLWLFALAALALLAPTTRQMSRWILRALDSWSLRIASARADDRLWSMAQQDPRVMSDLRSACARAEQAAESITAPSARLQARWIWHV